MLRWLWLWGPPIAEIVVLYWLSSRPDLGPLPGGVSDKSAHFAAFFVLAALALRATAGGRWAGVGLRSAAGAFAFAAAYGALDEWHQTLTPGRSPSVEDWIADASGAATAVVLGLIAARLVGRRPANRDV